jgi:hypothetical protein
VKVVLVTEEETRLPSIRNIPEEEEIQKKKLIKINKENLQYPGRNCS